MSMRKSKITKGISRKFNTAKYETLTIHVEYEEEVEWEEGDLKNRQAKSMKVSDILLDDFNNTVKQVFTRMGLKIENAYIEDPSDKNRVSASKLGLNLDEKSEKEDGDILPVKWRDGDKKNARD